MNIALQSSLSLSNEEYHRRDGESSSAIKQFLKSAKHYNKYMNELLDDDEEETKALRLGSLVHYLCLEADIFEFRYAIKKKMDGRTKEGKQYNLDFAAQNEGKIIIDESEYQTAQYMRDSVLTHPEATQLLKNGVAEQSYFYEDLKTGLLCKYRPDYKHEKYLVDIKTTKDASFNFFRNQLTNLKYHVSAAHYLEGEKVLFGNDHNNFIFICVESVAPFLAAVYPLEEESIQLGKRMRAKALAGIKECREKNVWSGYNDDLARYIGVSKWALNEDLCNE